MKQLVTVTKKEVSKVENNLLNLEQLQYLFKRTPETHIYKRPGKGGGSWEYVTGTYIKKILNLMFGWNWSFEVDKFDMNMEAKQCIVLGKLTVQTGGESIVKMQFGRADIKFKKDTEIPLDLGNDLKAATTDCLKKCASELGIAGDVYGKNEFKAINIVGQKPSTDQLNYLDSLIESCNLNDEETSKVKFSLPTDSMNDVQKKIESLIIIQDEKSITKQFELKLKLQS